MAEFSMLYPRESTFDGLITAAGAAHGVPVSLLKAVFANESAFNPAALGDQGRAFGIGQMWLATARGLGFKGSGADLFRPEIAIPLTAKYLAQGLRKYRGDQSAALSAYNAGHSMIPAAGPEKIVNNTNREYLRRGLIHRAYFAGSLSAPDASRLLKSRGWLGAAYDVARETIKKTGGAAVEAARANPKKTGGAAVLVLVSVGLGLFYLLTRR